VGLAGFLGEVVDPYLRQRARGRFADEGDDVTGAWQPLKPATQEIREQLGYGGAHPINIRTHELEAYIVDSPNNLSAHPWGATLTLPGNPAQGELRDKMERAQQGDDRTAARPVLGMNERDLAFVLLALGGFVKQFAMREL